MNSKIDVYTFVVNSIVEPKSSPSLLMPLMLCYDNFFRCLNLVIFLHLIYQLQSEVYADIVLLYDLCQGRDGTKSAKGRACVS